MLRRASVVLAAAAVVVLAVAACGSDDGDPVADRPEDPTTSASTSTTTATTTSSTLAPTPTTTATTTVPEDDAVLVQMITSGGLNGRGLGDLLVTASGEVTATGRDGQVAHGTLADDELRALADLLAGTDFAGLPADPGPGGSCADAFVSTVRYRQWTASADDCSTPAALAPVLDRLHDLLTRFA